MSVLCPSTPVGTHCPSRPAPSDPAPLSPSPQRCRWQWARAARRVACGRASRWPCSLCSGAARSARGAGAVRCGCLRGTRPAAVRAYCLAAATCCSGVVRGPLSAQEAAGPGLAPPAGASCCLGGTRGRGACGGCSGGSGGGAAELPEPAGGAGPGGPLLPHQGARASRSPACWDFFARVQRVAI